MNLADMLGYADIAQLTRIAVAYGCDCNGHSKHELIQSILTAVGRRELFDAQIDGMPIEDLRFLNSLLFDAREAFSLEELLARVRLSRFDRTDSVAAKAPEAKQAVAAKAGRAPVPGKRQRAKPGAKGVKNESAPAVSPEASLRETIARFKQSGWLFNGYSGTNRYLFHVPNDLKDRFRDALGRRFEARLHYGEEPAAYRDEQTLMAEDVLLFLGHIDKHDIPLTADGAMYKRNAAQLLELLSVREELPQKGPWRFGYGRRFKDFPDRLALIYDYSHYRRWISEADLRLTLTAAGKEKLEGRIREEPEVLYRFWLRLYKGAVPNVLSLVNWIDRLAARWVSADSLQAVLLPYVRPFYYDDAAAVLDKRVLGMMVHLGLLRQGRDDALGNVYKMTNAGRAAVKGSRIEEREGLTLD
ncbi:hypothetical protein BG53_03745 [Paenibacillus darwinianus]|uniref:Helicase XPB/Ssl2 N-terminal domain-containing protein n=1 Tax=Paenibacillus darwinianus TaxID=1380763 RepID=A0A9W5W895_9BACL|nr:hypothetical protein [Paenibacillus darwinianus]EXX91294.1 hypothetical protein BG52_10995 [Paenibacillus darwinianus]EXX92110.1 hypothetical protein BG53_03745 [Paenibacillus darwinianus]EXX92561.1 hypothetical protein CH50_10255 [Paenibacillus darwinianus]